MRRLALIFFLTMAVSPVFAASCGDMPVGFHEFAIFGGNHHVYLSHYPMFSSIHAYQVILEVELTADNTDVQSKFLTQLSSHPEISYTYSPYRKEAPGADRVSAQSDWVLPQKAQLGVMINGDIHYRQNNADVNFGYNVQATVIRVIESRLMNPGQNRPTSLSYIYFGDSTAGFLAHYVSAPANPGEQKPDFDQIIAVTPSTVAETGKVYAMAGRANDVGSKLKVGESANFLSVDGESLNVKVESELFTHSVMTDR